MLYLEHEGVLAASAVPGTPVEELVQRYRRWLVGDRGLAEATVERYVKLARLFLTQRSTELVHSVENLTGTDIVAFLLQESGAAEYWFGQGSGGRVAVAA